MDPHASTLNSFKMRFNQPFEARGSKAGHALFLWGVKETSEQAKKKKNNTLTPIGYLRTAQRD
jgi:hypothetical protein